MFQVYVLCEAPPCAMPFAILAALIGNTTLYMNQYVGIFRAPTATMDEWMKNTSKEEMGAQMKKMGADMNAWMAKHAGSFVGKGMPLGKTKTVSTAGVADGRNDLDYMQVVQAESHEAACAVFADCPHMSIPNATIDVMEVPNIMGMQ